MTKSERCIGMNTSKYLHITGSFQNFTECSKEDTVGFIQILAYESMNKRASLKIGWRWRSVDCERRQILCCVASKKCWTKILSSKQKYYKRFMFHFDNLPKKR